VVALVVTVSPALLSFVVVLDEHRVLTVGDVLGVAAWTMCCIAAWRMMWGRRR
jgi:hypothetical protein